MPRGANEQLPARRGRRREARFVQRILRDQLELRRRRDDERLAVIVEEVDMAATHHRRRAVTPAEALLPLELARLRVEAARDAVVRDDEEMPVVRDRGRDVADALVR